MMTKIAILLAALVFGLLALIEAFGGTAGAQSGHGHMQMGEPAATGTAVVPYRTTMEELHQSGGVPRGWKFNLPAGDAARGRQAFRELECYQCHTIQGEGFPAAGGDAKHAGPELTGMGGHHPAEYLAESILAPNRVIVQGPGYTGPDGLSIMPSYTESLSVTQLIDLVAYLKSRTAGHDEEAQHGATREQLTGDYRIRVMYMDDTTPGHLMAFIADREMGEPIPYLPVTATVQTSDGKPRTVKLAPMMSAQGFHYGATVTLPPETEKIALAVGATTMPVTAALKGRYKKPVTATFAWEHAGHGGHGGH